MPLKYGTFLGADIINNISLDIFSNGSCTHVSEEESIDDNGQYLGIKYQCVELVRRYLLQVTDDNFAQKWSNGDAIDWVDNIDIMGLLKKKLEDVNEGDIITFSGGKWGHIAIVARVSDADIYVTSQNFLNDSNDIRYKISKDTLSNHKAVYDANKNHYKFQAILRVNN